APSRHEAMTILNENPGIEVSVKKINKMRLASPAMMAFCHYVFSKQDQTLADMFFESLETGENMRGGDPVYLLRERLIQNRMSKGKLHAMKILALTFKAWQGTKTSTPMKALRWAVTEEFPSIEDDLQTGTQWRKRRKQELGLEQRTN